MAPDSSPSASTAWITGAHHVAGEQGDVVGEPVGDAAQGQVGARDQQLVGLRPLQRAERLAVPEDAAGVALLKVAAAAEEALAAGGAVGAQDAVALGDLADVVAGREHGADVLVADREAGLDRDPAVVDVQVGAADPGRLDPDHGLVGRGHLGLGLLLDPHLARGLVGDRAHQSMITRRAVSRPRITPTSASAVKVAVGGGGELAAGVGLIDSPGADAAVPDQRDPVEGEADADHGVGPLRRPLAQVGYQLADRERNRQRREAGSPPGELGALVGERGAPSIAGQFGHRRKISGLG